MMLQPIGLSTGRLDAFAPTSRKIHIDIDASSIGKNVRADIGIVGDAGKVLEDLLAVWKQRALKVDRLAAITGDTASRELNR